MKHTTLMTLILMVIQQTHAEQKVTALDPLIFQGKTEVTSVIIDKERIETSNTLGDTLKHVSGVQSTSFGPNAGAPVIRSLSGNRVSILENGQTINGMNAISGDINIPFDPLFTESVTVHKGTNSVRYGGTPLGECGY